MKLVEILARELKEWPDSVRGLTQSVVDGEIYSSHGKPEDDHVPLPPNLYLKKADEAENEEYPYITRDQWQAERDLMAAIEEGIKAADKGNSSPIGKVMAKWRRHRGGRTPNSVTDRIDLIFRDGETSEFRCPSTIRWRHINECDDVIAWRPSVIEEEKQGIAVTEMKIKVGAKEAIAAVGAEVARHVANHPFTWRDRIREIDAKQIALTNERAELVAKLATEGLALCAGHDIADEPMKDMDNPANWKAGDLIEIIGSDSHHFDIGEIVRLNVYERDHASDGHRYEHLDKSDYWWVKDVNAKFHSRP